MQPETKGAGQEPPSALVITRVDESRSPPPGLSHVRPASVAPGSTPSLQHYVRLKPAKATRRLVVFPSHDQLSCDTHPFFEGLHPLSTREKAFYNNVLSFQEDTLRVAR